MRPYASDLGLQKIHLLFDQGSLSLAISLINGVILAIVEWHRSTPEIVISWFASLALITVLRGYLGFIYKRDGQTRERSWAKLFAFGVFASGVLWGVAGYLFFTPNEPIYLSFIIFILGGMTAGSVAVLSPIHYLPSLYIVPALLPLAGCFIMQSDHLSFGMALLVGLYAVILILSGNRTHKAIEQSLILGLQNQELLNIVQEEKSHADEINDELFYEIELRTKAQRELKIAAGLLTEKNFELDNALKKANLASEAKSSFLAATSHEIRTPMTAIIGMTDLVLGTDLNDDQRENLQSVKSAASGLLVIINDVLDFAKIESGKVQIIRESFSIRELVEEVIKLFKIAAIEKEVDIFSFFQGDLPDILVGDSDRIRQVLVNLIGNSIKFTPPKGVIVCYIEGTVALDERLDVFFAVSDTGIGIRSDMIEKIFESFTQAEEYTTRLYGGTGLGLSISNRLVSLLGGQLGVKSILGVGSRFSFSIPMKSLAEDETAASIKIKENNDIQRKTELNLFILLVEDNIVNCKLFRAMLGKFGCKVNVANNGQEALDSLEKNKFDLILMDCQMPIMDGYETTQRIRAKEGKDGSRIPIIALTAHALETDKDRCLEVGMDEYLTKPVDRTKLFKTLSKFC